MESPAFPIQRHLSATAVTLRRSAEQAQLLLAALMHECVCRYGMLNKTDYPYWTVGALATANHYFQDEPLHVRTRECQSACLL
jgi:hypothetical protein